MHLAKWWSSACQITIGLDKIIPWVAQVLKILVLLAKKASGQVLTQPISTMQSEFVKGKN